MPTVARPNPIVTPRIARLAEAALSGPVSLDGLSDGMLDGLEHELRRTIARAVVRSVRRQLPRLTGRRGAPTTRRVRTSPRTPRRRATATSSSASASRAGPGEGDGPPPGPGPDDGPASIGAVLAPVLRALHQGDEAEVCAWFGKGRR